MTAEPRPKAVRIARMAGKVSTKCFKASMATGCLRGGRAAVETKTSGLRTSEIPRLTTKRVASRLRRPAGSAESTGTAAKQSTRSIRTILNAFKLSNCIYSTLHRQTSIMEGKVRINLKVTKNGNLKGTVSMALRETFCS